MQERHKLKRKGVLIYNRRNFSLCEELWNAESTHEKDILCHKETNEEQLKPRYILIKFFSFQDEEGIPQSYRKKKQITYKKEESGWSQTSPQWHSVAAKFLGK